MTYRLKNLFKNPYYFYWLCIFVYFLFFVLHCSKEEKSIVNFLSVESTKVANRTTGRYDYVFNTEAGISFYLKSFVFYTQKLDIQTYLNLKQGDKLKIIYNSNRHIVCIENLSATRKMNAIQIYNLAWNGRAPLRLTLFSILAVLFIVFNHFRIKTILIWERSGKSSAKKTFYFFCVILLLHFLFASNDSTFLSLYRYVEPPVAIQLYRTYNPLSGLTFLIVCYAIIDFIYPSRKLTDVSWRRNIFNKTEK